MKILALLVAGLAATSATVASAREGQVVEPFIDGMTIETSNTIANVEIRAKSLGPGACAVEFITNGARVQILAPLLTYSSWTVLTAATGKNSFTISDDVKCDTGIVAEVRYRKDLSLLKAPHRPKRR